MNKGQQNKAFLDELSKSYRTKVLLNIAAHYGITADQTLEEVLDEGAEYVYEYVTGQLKMGVYTKMARFLVGKANSGSV